MCDCEDTTSCGCDSESITIPNGPRGIQGIPGNDGENAFTTLTSSYIQPIVNTNVTIAVSNTGQYGTGWVAIGQIIYITLGGYYQVVSSTSTSITIKYTSEFTTYNQSLTAAAGTVPTLGIVSPGGLKGLTGANGTNGRGISTIIRTSGTGLAGSLDAYTITYSDTTTSTFTVQNGTNGATGATGAGYNATSVSLIDVLTNAATGGTWVMSTGKAYLPFSRIRVSFSTTEYFEGLLTAYNSGTGSFTISNIDLKVGASSHSAWNIAIAGYPGSGFIYETTDGNLTPTEATSNYQFLMRNSDNTGYTFVSLIQLKALLNSI